MHALNQAKSKTLGSWKTSMYKWSGTILGILFICGCPNQDQVSGAGAREIAISPTGVVVTGDVPWVEDLPSTLVAAELGPEAKVDRYFRVDGRGPRNLEVAVPLPDDPDVQVYRHVEEDLFLRVVDIRPENGEIRFTAGYPGTFVVCTAPDFKIEFPKALFCPPPSRDPALKEENWSLKRVHPDVLTGPTPLITFHDFNNLWSSENFIHWAAHSPEATDVRAHFQLWRCGLPSEGINAPIGYDSASPVFIESEVFWVSKMLDAATAEGVETDGIRHYFPAEGPIAVFAMSQGGLKIRAFMLHFPDYGERIYAVASMGTPHLGTPWATHEWVRYTASRIGTGKPTVWELIGEAAIYAGLNPVDQQFQRDLGWLNLDNGIPYREFTAWSLFGGIHERVLSPRDCTVTNAWEDPRYPGDTTIEPPGILDTYCGGMDLITPAFRGDKYADRFFLYGAYFNRYDRLGDILDVARSGERDFGGYMFETVQFRVFQEVMGLIETNGTEWPLTSYRLGDGQVPLQSHLMLDGQEGPYIYQTYSVNGWRYPKLPLEVDMDLVRTHTLGDPDKIRVYRGLTHQDLIQGMYNSETGRSETYEQVAADLLGAHP